MKITNSTAGIYCLYARDHDGEEHLYIQKINISASPKKRIDLFESERAAYNWLDQEQAAFAMNGRWGLHANYKKLMPGKISPDEVWALIDADEKIYCLTFTDENCVRRLYFRDEFASCFPNFAGSAGNIDPEETIYAVVRYGSRDEEEISLKVHSYITYPEIAYPLFSAESCPRASEFLAGKSDPDCYLEPVTLADIYQRVKQKKKDPGSFVLCRQDSPHYILRRKDLRRIVEGSGLYQ